MLPGLRSTRVRYLRERRRGDLRLVDDGDAVVAAIERGGAADVLGRLPDGIATQLGRTLGGEDLSTGQWQKLATGRSMMRTEPLLLVLDEPQSAFDPLSEHELFERYAASARELGDGIRGINVLISHRFSTVGIADLIVVLERSRVADVGSHDELMARGGLYAKLYELQARHYR